LRGEALVAEQSSGRFAPQIRQDEQEVTHIAYGIEPMRLIANSTPGLLIRAYTDEAITIQFAGTASNEPHEDTFEEAVWVHPEGVSPLGVQAPGELSAVLCEPIWQRSPELVIIGHCQSDLWLSAEQRALFLSRGVGLEVMKLGAACRTYNLLTADGRSVAALLFPKPR
jgi:uncharacterized protein